MKQRRFISRFTPSRTNPEDLEAIFVQRHSLLDDSVDRVRESALTKNKHHILFIGRRGCGKTHLMTLLNHRVENIPELKDKLRIAWLNEDETSTTFLDLLVRIYRALSKRYENEFSAQQLDDLYGTYETETARRVGELLVSHLKGRCLLVLIENLDEIFKALDDAGQKTLRAFIQNHRVFTIVATAQRLFDGVAKREAPFFGFFQTQHLETLSVEGASQLLIKIAELNNDTELVAFLRSHKGKSRVRALHHLSGGNHRIYIILSEFITRDSVDQLVRPFEEMVDELTPYYQERLRWLAPLQRKIVEFLCSCERPVPVKEVARKLFSTHQTIASQLKQLRELGYVEAHARGRESLYELKEPLMRLCVEVKNNQKNEPLRLIVDFLRIWYDEDRLKSHLSGLPMEAVERTYINSAMEKMRTDIVHPRIQFLLDDLEKCQGEKHGHERLDVLRELTDERGTKEDWDNLCSALLDRAEQEDPIQLISDLSRAIESGKITFTMELRAHLASVRVLNGAGRLKEAILASSKIISLENVPLKVLGLTLIQRGISFHELGSHAEALADFSRVLQQDEMESRLKAWAYLFSAYAFGEKGDQENEIRSFSEILKIQDAPLRALEIALQTRAAFLEKTGRATEALEDYSRLLTLEVSSDTIAEALLARGEIYGQLGRHDAQIEDCSKVIALTDVPAELLARALVNRAFAFGFLNQGEQQLADFSQVLELSVAPMDDIACALLGRGIRYGEQGDFELGIADYTRVINMPNAPVEFVSGALINRGDSLEKLGRTEESIADFSQVIGLSAGPIHWKMRALLSRAETRYKTDQADLAVEDFLQAIRLPEAPSYFQVEAYHWLARILFEQGQWEAGFEKLDQGLVTARADQLENAGQPEEYISAIIRAIGRETLWMPLIKRLIAVYLTHGFLTNLGDALVRSLGILKETMLNNEGLTGWCRAWENNASTEKELQIPMRIFATGINYLRKQDEGVLLDLAKEERAILRQALGLGGTDDKQTSSAESEPAEAD